MSPDPHNADDLDLFEARKAVSAAQFAHVRTDAVSSSARTTADGIRTIVEANGFLEKWRAVIQGGSAA